MFIISGFFIGMGVLGTALATWVVIEMYKMDRREKKGIKKEKELITDYFEEREVC